jgi:hypothetical protein
VLVDGEKNEIGHLFEGSQKVAGATVAAVTDDEEGERESCEQLWKRRIE